MPTNPVFMVGCRLPDGNEILYDTLITATPSAALTVYVDSIKWKTKNLSTATFTFNGSTWTLSGNAVVLSDYGVIITNGTPANGDTIAITSSPACTHSGNVVTVGIAPACFSLAGDGKLDLYIADGGEQLGTFTVTLRVERAAASTRGGLTPQSFVLLSNEVEAYVNTWLTLRIASYVNAWLTDEAGTYINAWLHLNGGDHIDDWLVLQAASYINAWLAAHPEATTTVLDGAITVSKLNNNIPYVDSEGYICMKGDWE